MKTSAAIRAAVLFGLTASAPAMPATITVQDRETVLEQTDGDVEIKGTGILRLTSETPIKGGTINLIGKDASLIFEGVHVSEIKEKYLSSILINGKAFNPEEDRLSLYGNGSEIIPQGYVTPLVIYKEEECKGESKEIDRDIYYRGKKVRNNVSYLDQEELGDFDNNIRSFVLKRGYTACFANNSDGTGFSRVFTATDRDLVVEEMPEGLEFASFIRVARADRVGKKGTCDANAKIVALSNSSWYYSWGASDESKDDYEYVPMRHNAGWDGWDKIGSRINTSCVLAYNEPDHTDQSNLTPDYAISEWDNFMKSGLRAGSPAPDNIDDQWLKTFLAMADSLNYRVDFVNTHMYQAGQSGDGLASRITKLCETAYGGRPMWITEWNNGANWTTEQWPDKEGKRLDADFNPLLNDKGVQETVKRPHTEKNSEKQANWLKQTLKAFDECPWLERHAFYNWVEDARAIELDGKLTPAGKVFAEFRSRPGFDPEYEYVHEWEIAPPYPTVQAYNTYSNLEFTDHNGETGVNYTVQRMVGNGDWEDYATVEAEKDYKFGGKVKIRLADDVLGIHRYRIRAKSYKGSTSIWSREMTRIVNTLGVSGPQTVDFDAKVENGVLYLTSPFGGSIQIYSASGALVRSVTLPSEETVAVEGLAKGVYIVKGYKILI